MRRFAYACLGVLALALAFHVGARSATAQGGGEFVGITQIASSGSGGASCALVAITAGGDLYRTTVWDYPCTYNAPFPTWVLWGHIQGATALEPTTWGQIKAKARE